MNDIIFALLETLETLFLLALLLIAITSFADIKLVFPPFWVNSNWRNRHFTLIFKIQLHNSPTRELIKYYSKFLTPNFPWSGIRDILMCLKLNADTYWSIMLSGGSNKYSFIMLVLKPGMLEKQNQTTKRKKVAHCLHQINQWPTWGKPGQTGCTDLIKCIDRTLTKSLWLPLDHDSRSEPGSFPLQAGFFYWALGGVSPLTRKAWSLISSTSGSAPCTPCPCPCTVTNPRVLGGAFEVPFDTTSLKPKCCFTLTLCLFQIPPAGTEPKLHHIIWAPRDAQSLPNSY